MGSFMDLNGHRNLPNDITRIWFSFHDVQGRSSFYFPM